MVELLEEWEIALLNFHRKYKKFQSNISVAIAYDNRKFSKEFAQWSAEVFSANKIKVYLFSELRPTPELSFAIRKLKCNCGIVITASHNPKEYNGYKVYWKDGVQITNPHDKLILNEINKLNNINEINISKNNKNISLLNDKIDKEYIKAEHAAFISKAPTVLRPNLS